MKTKNLRKENAITLVALIITIIVLLILAIVSINIIINNGILDKAKYGVDRYSEEQAREQIQLAVLESYDDNGNLDKTKLVANLEKIGASVEGTDFPYLVTLNKYKFTIYGGREINKVSNEAINSSKINSTVSNTNISSEQKRDFYRGLYGKTVNYPVKITTELTSSTGEGKGKWRIFYADENNIYLIADSRIKLPYSSEDTSQNSFLSGYITYSQWCGIFATSYNNGIFPKYPINNLEYNGTFPTNITKYADESTLKNLNNSYYSQGFSPNTANEGLASLSAIASMLDTDVWSAYRDTKYAQYAIGGPSVEMLCNSYSQTHEHGVEAKAFAKQSGVADQFGYKIKISDEDEYKYNTDNNFLSNDLEGIYSSKCWLCSPSSRTDYARIMTIDPYRKISDNYYNQSNYSNTGFRPLVCLKSNVQLEKSSNSEFDYELK